LPHAPWTLQNTFIGYVQVDHMVKVIFFRQKIRHYKTSPS